MRFVYHYGEQYKTPDRLLSLASGMPGLRLWANDDSGIVTVEFGSAGASPSQEGLRVRWKLKTIFQVEPDFEAVSCAQGRFSVESFLVPRIRGCSAELGAVGEKRTFCRLPAETDNSCARSTVHCARSSKLSV